MTYQIAYRSTHSDTPGPGAACWSPGRVLTRERRHLPFVVGTAMGPTILRWVAGTLRRLRASRSEG